MPRQLLAFACFTLLPTALVIARQPADDAPPADLPDEPVLGSVQPVGWGLQGAQGRHYFFGGMAMGDYTWQGRHRVVTLAEETTSEQADPKFLYYRELGDGHRWAVAKSPDRDRSYSVYIQPRGAAAAAGQAKWTLFHRAKLIEDSRFPEDRRATSAADSPPRLNAAASAPRVPPSAADPARRLSRPVVVVEAESACCGR